MLMVEADRFREPVYPYLVRGGVVEAALAQIERTTGIALPPDWPDYEPHYLNDAAIPHPDDFNDAVDSAISGADPGRRLIDELLYLQRELAEMVIAELDSTGAGRAVLDSLRASVIEQLWTERRQQEEQTDDGR
jgi:hypothetical protein